MDSLSEVARRSASNAYCPYSNFPVGAAVLLNDGDIFSGCNVENSSFGLTICAERNALFQAIARKGSSAKILKLIIFTPTPAPTVPCGACRQVIQELAPDAVIECICNGEGRIQSTISEIFPQPFRPSNLHAI